MDFFVWKQHATEVSSESECPSNSAYVKTGNAGKCYRYDVLERICLLTSYVEHPDTATYSWDYAGGCFQNGEIALYKPAEIGSTYDFTHVDIEVRQNSEGLADESSSSSGGFLSSVASGICSLLSIIGLVFMVFALILGAMTVWAVHVTKRRANEGIIEGYDAKEHSHNKPQEHVHQVDEPY